MNITGRIAAIFPKQLARQVKLARAGAAQVYSRLPALLPQNPVEREAALQRSFPYVDFARLERTVEYLIGETDLDLRTLQYAISQHLARHPEITARIKIIDQLGEEADVREKKILASSPLQRQRFILTAEGARKRFPSEDDIEAWQGIHLLASWFKEGSFPAALLITTTVKLDIQGRELSFREIGRKIGEGRLDEAEQLIDEALKAFDLLIPERAASSKLTYLRMKGGLLDHLLLVLQEIKPQLLLRFLIHHTARMAALIEYYQKMGVNIFHDYHNSFYAIVPIAKNAKQRLESSGELTPENREMIADLIAFYAINYLDHEAPDPPQVKLKYVLTALREYQNILPPAHPKILRLKLYIRLLKEKYPTLADIKGLDDLRTRFGRSAGVD